MLPFKADSIFSPTTLYALQKQYCVIYTTNKLQLAFGTAKLLKGNILLYERSDCRANAAPATKNYAPQATAICRCGERQPLCVL